MGLAALMLAPAASFPSLAKAAPPATQVQDKSNYVCGGSLEKETWQIWDQFGKAYLANTLEKRLVGQGDTYALYDLQTAFHNLHDMAVRCKRIDRQREFARLLGKAYSQLEPESGQPDRRQWICRGGRECTATNRLANTEVVLTSAQYLGFITAVANELHRVAPGDAESNAFAQKTARIAVEHLLRWGDPKAQKKIRRYLAAGPSDVVDGGPPLFLTDKTLWQLMMYANVAGMVQRDDSLRRNLNLNDQEWAQLGNDARLLMQFVQRRITTELARTADGSAVTVADLDAGYWRYYASNRYAAYDGNAKPVVCRKDEDGKQRAERVVAADEVPILPNIGWDFSHARRLVHFFDAIERNRGAIEKVFSAAARAMPPREINQAFAWQLYVKIWNQDKRHPLFSNYFSGANGWYRVALDTATGSCSEGYSPYGLTDSFATGGYATWGKWVPSINVLARQLYAATLSAESHDKDFINSYYSDLGESASNQTRERQQIMFWPTLVGTD